MFYSSKQKMYSFIGAIYSLQNQAWCLYTHPKRQKMLRRLMTKWWMKKSPSRFFGSHIKEFMSAGEVVKLWRRQLLYATPSLSTSIADGCKQMVLPTPKAITFWHCKLIFDPMLLPQNHKFSVSTEQEITILSV